jgi:hypothetical protein
MKLISFVVIGGMTLIYVVAELGVAVWLGSLTLLSDGYAPLSSSNPRAPTERHTALTPLGAFPSSLSR